MHYFAESPRAEDLVRRELWIASPSPLRSLFFFFFEREEVFRVPKRGNSGQGGKVSETLAMDEGKDNVKSC